MLLWRWREPDKRHVQENMERRCEQGYERLALKTEWCYGSS